jgi:hypothetical protein
MESGEQFGHVDLWEIKVEAKKAQKWRHFELGW